MRTVGIRLVADTSMYMSKLKQAGSATQDFAGQLDKTAKAGHLDKVADQALKVGIVGVAAFAGVVKSAADFDKQMSAVSAATHASSAEMGQLRAAALQAGKDTQYSATQAAEGITEMSKAGVQTADILGGGLKGALDLAAAGQLGVGQSAEIAATALTQFQLKGAQLPHVADVLSAAAGKAQGSVADMSVALKYAGLPAHNLGMSLEETAGTLALFAKNGLIGEQAGTSFRGVLASLTGPSEKAAGVMEDLGLKVYGANGKFVGMASVAEQLRTKLGGLSAAQRDAALATIFGRENLQAAIILMQGGASKVKEWTNNVNDQGYATETAARLTDNLAGDIERLKGSLETLAIQSGSGANGGIRVFTKSLNALVNQFLGMPSAVSSAVTVIAGVAGALALGLAGFIKLRRGVAAAKTELIAMGPAGERAAAGLGKAASVGGKAVGVFGLLMAAGAVLGAAFGKDLNPQIDALTLGLQRFVNTGVASGEIARVLGDDMGKFDLAVKDVADTGRWSSLVRGIGSGVESFTQLGSAVDTSLTKSKERLDAIDQALKGLVDSGNAAQAAQIFNALAQRAQESGISVSELRAVLPGYTAALETAAGATGATAKASGAAATATGQLGAAAKDAKKDLSPYEKAQQAAAAAAKGHRNALIELSSALLGQYNPVVGLIDAMTTFKDKQDAAAKALKGHKRNSVEVRQADLELAQAALNLTGKVGALGNEFNGHLSPAMRQTLKNAGLTKGQINNVEAAFKSAKTAGDKFARSYQANVSIRNDKSVGHALGQLSLMQQYLKTGGRPPSPLRRAFAFAEGGWTGPGSRNTPAGIVHADEYVVNKPSRRNLEAARPGGLDYMNRTGRWPGYAAGGLVGWPFPTTAAMTRIPSRGEAMAAVGPPGGQTYKWIERVVRAAFPGMRVLSDFRPGARTLSGNVSYHALGRAVDFPPSRPLAEWFNVKFKSRIKELITPYQDLNLLNGARHTYTGAIWNQHNFAGGNAHDHVAMDGFGVGGGSGWMPSGGGGGGNTYVTVQAGYVVTPQELENRIAFTIDRLRAKGRM